MYKMLVIDLDGTLLDDTKEIPEENKKAIQRLHDDFGIIPVIATARPLEVARYIADKGGDAFQSYIIATNGAILMDIQKQEYLINKSLTDDQIHELVSTCKGNDLVYEFMTTKCEVADIDVEARRAADPMCANNEKAYYQSDNLEKYLEDCTDPIPLFSISGMQDALVESEETLKSIPGLQFSAMCVRKTFEDGEFKTLAYFDIMREGVTKASAIERLAEHLGIEKKEIIAIGDGGNDIEMLQTAGLKIAMKNASDRLKEIADVITPVDNNHGGVGAILNEVYMQLERKTKSKGKSKQIPGGQEPGDM